MTNVSESVKYPEGGMGLGSLGHIKSSREERKLGYCNFWNMGLDEMIDKLGE
jgi:hypothetical protein